MARHELDPTIAAPGPFPRLSGRRAVGATHGLLCRGSEGLVGDEIVQGRTLGVGRRERSVGEDNVTFVAPDGGGGVGYVPLAEELAEGWKCDCGSVVGARSVEGGRTTEGE
jgi:hypothetical protein